MVLELNLESRTLGPTAIRIGFSTGDLVIHMCLEILHGRGIGARRQEHGTDQHRERHMSAASLDDGGFLELVSEADVPRLARSGRTDPPMIREDKVVLAPIPMSRELGDAVRRTATDCGLPVAEFVRKLLELRCLGIDHALKVHEEYLGRIAGNAIDPHMPSGGR